VGSGLSRDQTFILTSHIRATTQKKLAGQIFSLIIEKNNFMIF
jgi:hypothetical protein